jgi:hypothetical protein
MSLNKYWCDIPYPAKPRVPSIKYMGHIARFILYICICWFICCFLHILHIERHSQTTLLYELYFIWRVCPLWTTVWETQPDCVAIWTKTISLKENILRKTSGLMSFLSWTNFIIFSIKNIASQNFSKDITPVVILYIGVIYHILENQGCNPKKYR